MDDTHKEFYIFSIIPYLSPLTWFVYAMWKLDYLRQDQDNMFWLSSESFYIARWIFYYIPATGTTKKGTKFCGNWHYFRLIFWEIHLLIRERQQR
jgi:hypothetical protein